jgi:hypothetical protein
MMIRIASQRGQIVSITVQNEGTVVYAVSVIYVGRCGCSTFVTYVSFLGAECVT